VREKEKQEGGIGIGTPTHFKNNRYFGLPKR